LCRRLRIDGASAAQPHCDLITDGSVKQKHDALSVIQRRFDPALVRALRLAEADPDQSVRVLAATVAIKLQTRFASQIEDLQAAATEARTIDAWLALADAHARFGASGLLSVTDAREQFAMAAARHQDALDCACAADPARFPLVQQIVRVIEDQWPAPARPQAPEPRGQTFGGGLR
jgi:hypothetical protein